MLRADGLSCPIMSAAVLFVARPVISGAIICTFAAGTCIDINIEPSWWVIAGLRCPLCSAGDSCAIAAGGRVMPIAAIRVGSIVSGGAMV